MKPFLLAVKEEEGVDSFINKIRNTIAHWASTWTYCKLNGTQKSRHMPQNLGPVLYFMMAIKLSQKTTPFSCTEHIPSSKTEEFARFLRFLKKIYQNCVNKL